MPKFKLTNNFEKRLKNFVSSKLFSEKSKDSKSPYWEHHSRLINFKIENSILEISGASGNYIPEVKNSYKHFLKLLKITIKDILKVDARGPDSYFFLNYKKAFNKIMKEKRFSGFQQLEFNKKKILADSYNHCKKIFPFNYEINDHIIRSYYYLNILNSYLDLNKNLSVIEIGGGNGNLISLIKSHFKSNCVIDIDLSETLLLAVTYLNHLFPNSKILLPNEINFSIDEKIMNEHDFIFLKPSQINLIKENSIDLSINSSSFHEMNKMQISEYVQLIQNVSKKGAYFFNTNSVEKIPYDGDKSLPEFKKTPPTRFFEYPYCDNEILIYQICRFTNFVQHIPFYLRLEKIIK
ncbi:MAG: hypothetical protein CMJ01_04065 [Pelagibacteraceae bacterium]|nr:hypothetical protein [Pelagibacteraceae bacterium]|tara:strand:- start:3473 stop:4525 length:1053 start_codon:yes stop_codon:yes gene_type:complete